MNTMKHRVIIPEHDDVVYDCIDSLTKEFAGLSSREYLLVLRTLDFVYEKGKIKWEENKMGGK